MNRDEQPRFRKGQRVRMEGFSDGVVLRAKKLATSSPFESNIEVRWDRGITTWHHENKLTEVSE